MSALNADAERIMAELAPLLPRMLVALDFDGTLAPIVNRPEDARALPETVEVLTEVAERVARLAIVTGRPAADAVRLGELDGVPGLEVYGHYGLERWRSGRLDSPAEAAGVAAARERVLALAGARAGVTVEDKGHSVAVHTRQAEDPGTALVEIRPEVVLIAAEAGLQVTPGRYVLELRPNGVDKGAAIRALVTEVSPSAVLYGGDDLGDLPAVDAVRALEAESIKGVVVCSDSAEVAAEFRDRADLVVAGPEGLLTFLRTTVQSEM